MTSSGLHPGSARGATGGGRWSPYDDDDYEDDYDDYDDDYDEDYDDDTNPQEGPPPPSQSSSTSRIAGVGIGGYDNPRRAPCSLYDIYLDLPHPGGGGYGGGSGCAGGGSGGGVAGESPYATADTFARVIDPPSFTHTKARRSSPSSSGTSTSRSLGDELRDPEFLQRLSRLAFPEYDDAAVHHHPNAVRGGHRATAVAAANANSMNGDGIVPNIGNAASSRWGSAIGRGGVGSVGNNHSIANNANTTTLTSHGMSLGTNLSCHDVYLVDFSPGHHTLSITLGGGGGGGHRGDGDDDDDVPIRMHGHVRRYLPRHADARTRLDIGRRRPRVMILLTRATGGEGFYNSLLKSVESIMLLVESSSKMSRGALASGGMGWGGGRNRRTSTGGHDIDPVTSFLHGLHAHHHRLITGYAALRRNGLGLNFASSPSSYPPVAVAGGDASYSPCDAARRLMEENLDLFSISSSCGIEYGTSRRSKMGGSAWGGAFDRHDDALRFRLPISLQPGYECLPIESTTEDVCSPIIPLLRYIGPCHFVRLLSALLCERNVIFVSKSTTRLSSCVRAASSTLSQGSLAWRHVLIPVVPAHMLKYIGGNGIGGGGGCETPYLVGVLQHHATRLFGKKVDRLTNVLCVNVDRNELRTLNMQNPNVVVPDMLRRARGEEPNAAEVLARDLDEIVRADRNLWDHQDDKAGGGGGGGGGSGGGAPSLRESFASSRRTGGGAPSLRESFASSKRSIVDSSDRTSSRGERIAGSGRFESSGTSSFLGRMKAPLFRRASSNDGAEKGLLPNNMTLEEKRQYATSVDAAVAFGRMIRSTFHGLSDELIDGKGTSGPDGVEGVSVDDRPRYVAPSSHDVDVGSVEPWTASENEGGDEDVRAALTCFFLHAYGDMGMYLSETRGTFWLDRRKFLLRKKQLGERENSPTFLVLQKLSASAMFSCHVKGRIDDMSLTARERSNIMPHHIPLFDICSKYLSVHRLDFSLLNVRRIVARTVLACVRHMVVESHVATRTMALSLTGDVPFVGNAPRAMSDLVESCRECNTHLSVVMSVIWQRLNQTKSSMQILMALHLLKKLISEGPMTAIVEALDGAGKIYELKNFSDAKNVDVNREVRVSADQVYGMLVDLPSLFFRRRCIAASKAQQLTAMPPTNQKMWSDYLVSRLPMTVEAHKLHALFRPHGIGLTYYDADASVAPSVAASNAPSGIMALARMRSVAPASNALNLDDSERLFDSTNQSLQEGYMMPWEATPAGELNSSESDSDGEETPEDEFFPAEDMVSVVQPPLSTFEQSFHTNEEFSDLIKYDDKGLLA